MRVRWPFVGRNEELDIIRTAMKDDGVPGMVLAGAAGVGKTRLLWEAIRSVDTDQFLPRSVVATAATSTIPFGALSALLPAELPSPSSVRNLLGYVADALLKPAGDRRLVVGVDDAHVLDETSAGLLYQLVQSGKAFVLASVRSGERAPEPITALWKDELVDRIEVQTLARSELEGVLEGALGAQVDSGTVQGLWEATQGNMLFLRELVNAGIDSGALTEFEGVWQWQGDWVFAPRLIELLEHRIGKLSKDELHALEVVAYGAPVNSTILTEVVDLDVLQSVEEKNLLWTSEQEVHLTHPLYGELLRSRCPTMRSTRWKTLLADTFEAAGPPSPDDLMRIATWRLDAGRPMRPETLMAAVAQAWSRMDTELCNRFATAAIAAGAGLPAVQMLWRVLYYEGRHAEAETFLSQWMPAPMAEPDRADLVMGRAVHLFWGAGELEKGRAVLEAAIETTKIPPIEQEYRALAALCYIIAGDEEASLAAADTVIDATPVINPHAVAFANISKLAVQVHMGDLGSDGLERFGAVGELARPWDDEFPFMGDINEWLEVKYRWLRGDLLNASKRANELLEFARQNRTEDWIQTCEVQAARVANLRGRPLTAHGLMRAAASRYRRQPRPTKRVGGQIFGELALAAAVLGRAGDAERSLREAERELLPSYQVFKYHLGFARPWVCAARGDRPRAVELARSYARNCRDERTRSFEVLSLHDVVRLGAPEKAVERLRELAAELSGPLVSLVAAEAAALVVHDGAVLDTVAEGFERIGSDLCAAEAFAAASLAHDAEGKQASSRSSATRAALALDRCEGARTPMVEAIRAPELTPRERDIALLAARGLSSKEIAERLVLSKRTIDNHLHQVYTKLGVSGRSSLAGMLGTEI